MDMIFLHMECPFFYVDTDTVSNNNYELSYTDFNKWFLYDLYIHSHVHMFTELIACNCLTVELLA